MSSNDHNQKDVPDFTGINTRSASGSANRDISRPVVPKIPKPEPKKK